MATASVPNGNFVNGTAADADQVDANFAALVSFLNNSTVHRDGTKAMTAAFDTGGFRVTNVAAATAVSDSPRFDQTGFGQHEVRSGALVLPAGVATSADSVEVTLPGPGVGLLVVHGTFTCSGVTPPGFDSYVLTLSVDGATWVSSGDSAPVSSYVTTANPNGSIVFTLSMYVGLASGANTLDVKLARNGTGGTATVADGLTSTLIGAF